ncbi:PAS domain-containing protein [Sphingomonas sp. G124]|uniref:histidine kinase n=1 Tax=Sphingomonas cremea TaxID=2904799 RepID=A0A9X1QHT2_9SPHN|nr:histidine kinase dimerization/phosphoacceptor domain -containing protein [Sphingomonas cremea]MCF2513973.1 PAS domain-containing protein [Sphingomonas cremea]
MEFFTPLHADTSPGLAMALVASSQAPLLLLDDDIAIVGASRSFCDAFGCDPDTVNGLALAKLGAGEWNAPQLHALLRATFSGAAAIDAYEMDLVREGQKPARLLLNALRLDYGDGEVPRVLLTVTDVTTALLAAKLRDDMVQEKDILLQELQHRVANSLQIIASVLMQSARRVQSEETRVQLHNAHHRVMSIATLQRQLAISSSDDVALRKYFEDLCASLGASMIDNADRISLVSSADDTVTKANVSVSLGLIVTELVINSLKHAFPSRKKGGHINVDYLADEKGWTLTVDDDGVGMPQGEGALKPGLGTGIVEALSRQLGAIVEVADRAPGTKVSIVHVA